ncbi:unnamed protein product [Rhizopus stolonifer]
MSRLEYKENNLLNEKLDQQIKDKSLKDSPDKHPLDISEESSDEEDKVPDDLPEFVPTNRGRRTSISAESIEPSVFTKIKIPKSDLQCQRIRMALADNFLFCRLDEEQVEDVVNAMAVKSIKASSEVIKQGDPGDYFYVVESGELDCSIDHQKVTVLKPKDSFGELALMYNAPRAATIVANEDCVLYALDRITFRSILMDNTSQKRIMYERFLNEVPVFKSLEAYERHKISDALESVVFEDKDVIIREGDVGEDFYLIESGEAIFYKTLKDGTRKQVMIGKKGDYFGELALINDKPRAVSVISNGRLKCATLGKNAFTRLLGPVMDILKRNSENYHAVLQQSL